MHTKTKSLALVLVVLASIVVVPLSFVAPAAAAPPAATASPQQIAESFIYYRAIAECFDRAGNPSIPITDIGSYNWFASIISPVAVGYMNGKDGTALCNDTGMVSRAMSMWGYSDGLTAWCDLMQQAGPFQETPGLNQPVGANRDCVSGNQSNVNTENKPEQRGFSFKRTIENKYYGAPGSPKLSQAAEYYVYSQTFNTFCNAKQIAQVSQADPSQLALANSDTGYKIKVVNQDGTVAEWIYQATGDQKKDDRITTYQNETDVGGAFKPTCGELAQWASNAAAAYGQWQANNQTAALPTGNTTGANNNGTGDKTISCGGGDWDWAICPFILLAQEAAIKLDGFITGMLNIDAKLIFDNTQSPGSAYYAAWNTFRIMATALIIIAGLVMVISQALGFEFLDAYTIRKVLPRLVVAVIGISLSWPLMAFFVNLFNIIGFDLRSLIYAPFSHLGGGINPALGLSSYFVLFAGGVVLTGLGLLSLVGTALLAMLVAFFILVVRQIAIIVLVVAAPVAIACYILPNTHKGWKLWYDSFLGVLLMFPIISAFIAAGHVFAAVAFSPQAGGSQFGSNTLAQIVGLVAYFIPYFMLPIAFRLATGLVSTLAGFVNDRSKGGFDRLKKFRQTKSAESLRDLKAGSRFNPQSRATRVLGGNMINRVGSHAGAGVRGRFGFGATGAARRANEATLTMDGAARENKQFAAQMNNEGAMAALAFGNNERKLRALRHYQIRDPNDSSKIIGYKEDALKADMAAARSIGVNRRNMSAGAEALAKSGKIINDRDEAESLYRTVAGGNEALYQGVKGNYQFTSRGVGRADIGRNSAYESIRELDMGSVARLKPLAAANLFGTDEAGRSKFHEAVASASNEAEREQMYDVLYAAQYNSYTSPEQQAAIAQTIASAKNDPKGRELWDRAQEHYSSKMNAGRNTSNNIPGQPPGQPPQPPSPGP